MSGKKFRFSLQKVLDLRRHETEHARHVLADAEADLEAKQAQLERARERLAECHRSTAHSGALRPAMLRKGEAFRQEARQAVTEARNAVAVCQQRVEEARAELQERRQAEEALEKLREQEKQQHEQEQAKAETAFLDEQAVLRFARVNPMSLTS